MCPRLQSQHRLGYLNSLPFSMLTVRRTNFSTLHWRGVSWTSFLLLLHWWPPYYQHQSRRAFGASLVSSGASCRARYPDQHISECVGVPFLAFFGRHVDNNGICPLETKVQTIHDFPQPTSHRKLLKFMGLINFYCRFIPHCALILHLLNSLLKVHNHPSDTLVWLMLLQLHFMISKTPWPAPPCSCTPP